MECFKVVLLKVMTRGKGVPSVHTHNTCTPGSPKKPNAFTSAAAAVTTTTT